MIVRRQAHNEGNEHGEQAKARRISYAALSV